MPWFDQDGLGWLGDHQGSSDLRARVGYVLSEIANVGDGIAITVGVLGLAKWIEPTTICVCVILRIVAGTLAMRLESRPRTRVAQFADLLRDMSFVTDGAAIVASIAGDHAFSIMFAMTSLALRAAMTFFDES